MLRQYQTSADISARNLLCRGISTTDWHCRADILGVIQPK